MLIREKKRVIMDLKTGNINHLDDIFRHVFIIGEHKVDTHFKGCIYIHSTYDM